MFSSRSTVTLRRAPNYYSKNAFPQEIQENQSNIQTNRFEFYLEGTPYLAEENIGAGAFGIVCKAIDMRFEKQIAIKKINKAYKSPSSAKCALREIRILREISHENIINVTDVFVTGTGFEKDIYMVMELMETDLHSVLRSNQKLKEDHFKYFFYQIIRGLKYLHSAGIIHRDLKPLNLLLNGNCLLKIADFGISRTGPTSKPASITPPSSSSSSSSSSGHLSQYVSTLWYRAPEILLSMGEYDKKVDMWAAGCILGEMLLRRELFPGKDAYSQIEMIIDHLGTPEKKAIKRITSPTIRDYIVSLGPKNPLPYDSIFPNASSEARDVISNLLQISPWNRCSAEQILEHSFLSKWHNLKNEPSCSQQVAASLRNIENYEGQMIIKALDEDANHFEMLRGGSYGIEKMEKPEKVPEKVEEVKETKEVSETPKISLKNVLNKIKNLKRNS
ncbi:hypothetical protein GCK72_005955 [Caenorhabditis remanei]|uniref:mitogen-activated protein kinase n=1 Tax=Caenorhabditis remanei TaxID=31234 RepID=A0A6A5HDZ4_CAERE|nr:hypothetical protein GCK72_005955 [Caenorhabditis remanei]KAF1766000.1 hypothetical protein GCK72_005955 [Caenorhabditis remanei]